MIIFEAADAVVKIGQSLRPNQHKQFSQVNLYRILLYKWVFVKFSGI